VQLTDISPPTDVYIERIDDDHANAKNAWLQMGKPQFPTPRQVEVLNVASQLVRETQTWKYENASAWLDVTLPPHSVAAVTLELSTSHHEGAMA
jgi:xylan 1,4-beta-xylosidase